MSTLPSLLAQWDELTEQERVERLTANQSLVGAGLLFGIIATKVAARVGEGIVTGMRQIAEARNQSKGSAEDA